MTTSITVRLSEEEVRELKKYGSVSEVVREAIHLYIRFENTRQTLKRLQELQTSHRIRATTEEDLRLLREDRQR